MLHGAPHTWKAKLLSGRLRAATGMATGALEDLFECGQLLERDGIWNPAVVPWRPEAALVLHGLDRTNEARELASYEVDLARRWGTVGPLAAALRVKASVDGGDREIAILDEALSIVDEERDRLERGQVPHRARIRPPPG